MTLTTERPERMAPPPSWRVTIQLARVEARRMLRNPILWLTVILASYMMWHDHAGMAPVLNRVGASTSFPLLLVGAGGLLLASEAALRMWRTDRSEAIDVSPASDRVRTSALLLASSAPLAVALALQVVTLTLQVLDDPVTGLDWWDVLTGPMAVAVLIVAGVAAGRWIPSRLTGPLTLVIGLVLSSVAGMYALRLRFGEVTRWFGLYVPLDSGVKEIEFRPSLEHLVYLLGFLVLLVTLAVLKGRLVRGWIPIAALAVGGALIATGAIGQVDAYRAYDANARLTAYTPPVADYVCETSRGVEYCALRGYQTWIGEWRAQVEPVLDLVPAEVGSLSVRQYPARSLDNFLMASFGSTGNDFSEYHDLATGVLWGRMAGSDHRWDDAFPFGMALGTAAWAVGFPTEGIHAAWVDTLDEAGFYDDSVLVTGDLEGIDPSEIRLSTCDAGGQGRAVLAFWMAAQASSEAEQTLRNLIERPRYPLVEEFVDDEGVPYLTFQHITQRMVGQAYPWWAIMFSYGEAYYAYQLLNVPDDEVLSLIVANWAELTDPGTTTGRATELLGVEMIPGHREVLEYDSGSRRSSVPCP